MKMAEFKPQNERSAFTYNAGKQNVRARKKGQRKKFSFAVPGGEPAGIQTPTLLIRSQMLYSVKLQALVTMFSIFLDCKCKE